MNEYQTADLKSLRVDLVGSLLRPQSVKDAFVMLGGGRISEAQLRQVQDQAIREVAKQVAVNLPIVVDGEFRRTSFMESFFRGRGSGGVAGRSQIVS